MNDESRIERRHLRVRLGEDENFTSEVSPDGTTSVRGRITVLGIGGACVEVTEAIPVGSPLSLSFTLPGTNEQILCGGGVRNRVSDSGLGIEFFFMTPEDRQRLTTAVMSHHLSTRA